MTGRLHHTTKQLCVAVVSQLPSEVEPATKRWIISKEDAEVIDRKQEGSFDCKIRFSRRGYGVCVSNEENRSVKIIAQKKYIAAVPY